MPSSCNVHALFVEFFSTLLLMGYKPIDFESERYTQMKTRWKLTWRENFCSLFQSLFRYAFYPLCHGNHWKASACSFPVITKTSIGDKLHFEGVFEKVNKVIIYSTHQIFKKKCEFFRHFFLLLSTLCRYPPSVIHSWKAVDFSF